MTSVKICGITSIEDARTAAEAGADYLGFIFYHKSARKTDPSHAAQIIRMIKGKYTGIRPVGVFVDESLQEIEAVTRQCGLELLQLHGNESPAFCDELRSRVAPVMKVLKIGPGVEVPDFTQYEVQHFLCDTYNSNAQGGTGSAFAYELLPSGLPLEKTFIAGGLTPGSVGSVVSRLRPYGVDVASGVEISPGVKSPELVRQFIAAAKAAG